MASTESILSVHLAIRHWQGGSGDSQKLLFNLPYVIVSVGKHVVLEMPQKIPVFSAEETLGCEASRARPE